MRLEHFDAIAPICPVCREGDSESPLKLMRIDERHSDDVVLQGLLECTNPACRREFPIIDGIPLLLRDLQGYLMENASDVLLRTDLSDVNESILGDCCGPSSRYNTIRQQLSSYVWDHYAEFDPQESDASPPPGSMLRALESGIQLAGLSLDAGPVLDLGCGVGRGTFSIASRTDSLVLGVDLHYPMLRLAGGLTRNTSLRYPRRRVGMVYDRREFSVELPNRERVDFWACDATALPFRMNLFTAAVSMNLLDCVHSPLDLLHSLSSVLTKDARAVVASPYDWSESVTPPEHWLGGHSQRGELAGSSESILRHLLDSETMQPPIGLQLTAEADHEWHVRLHERSSVSYKTHLVALQKVSTAR